MAKRRVARLPGCKKVMRSAWASACEIRGAPALPTSSRHLLLFSRFQKKQPAPSEKKHAGSNPGRTHPKGIGEAQRVFKHSGQQNGPEAGGR
ncbi:hypothetical protein LSM04_006927 [Trypanosoma melophagium]|uniref:uncharacterized protein n=1 Tax=Trypanosoma melophagium TaxID=715481 RepID=UPI00351A0CDE|nr:hypothetical protein LSM04_006927 [Trypanosoma melophagium]